MINKILDTISSAVERFEKKVPALDRYIMGEISTLVKSLSIKNGKLVNSVQNLQILAKIKIRLGKIILSKEYIDVVKEFVESFNYLSKLNEQYFRELMKSDFKRSSTVKMIKRIAIESTINDLIGQGITEAITGRLTKILQQNISTGGSYSDFHEELRSFIVGKETGVLERYTKTIVTDAINQYNAQYHDAIAQDLNLNWGRYVGSNVEATREFCERLTAKDFVHRSELPKIIAGEINGVKLKLNKRTGLPNGMIEGTNEYNFHIRRGGHNCGHQFYYIPDAAVPKHIRDKFEKSGRK